MKGKEEVKSKWREYSDDLNFKDNTQEKPICLGRRGVRSEMRKNVDGINEE